MLDKCPYDDRQFSETDYHSLQDLLELQRDYIAGYLDLFGPNPDIARTRVVKKYFEKHVVGTGAGAGRTGAVEMRCVVAHKGWAQRLEALKAVVDAVDAAGSSFFPESSSRPHSPHNLSHTSYWKDCVEDGDIYPSTSSVSGFEDGPIIFEKFGCFEGLGFGMLEGVTVAVRFEDCGRYTLLERESKLNVLKPE